jgi:hypothetical protein
MTQASRGTAAMGTHPVKTSKPGSETQRPHAFSHARNIDPADQHMNENTHDGGPSPTWNTFVKVQLLQGIRGRRKWKRGRWRFSKIRKPKTGQAEERRMCIESC